MPEPIQEKHIRRGLSRHNNADTEPSRKTETEGISMQIQTATSK